MRQVSNSSYRPRGPVVIAAVLVPLLVCLLLSGVRDSIENTNAALLLVLVVVGVAALGSRVGGTGRRREQRRELRLLPDGPVRPVPDR